MLVARAAIHNQNPQKKDFSVEAESVGFARRMRQSYNSARRPVRELSHESHRSPIVP